MTAVAAEPSPSRLQPSLFADLPETARRRAPRRPRSAPALAESGESGASEAPFAPPAVQFAPPPPPDPAEMSQAELRALAAALPDAKLAFLLMESARETRRRIAPPAADLDFDHDGAPPPEPNPALLRAAAAASGELSGEDDLGGGYAAPRNVGRRNGGRAK